MIIPRYNRTKETHAHGMDSAQIRGLSPVHGGLPSAEDFGAGTGRALADLGDRFGVMLRMKEETDLKGAEHALLEWQREYLYNPDTGIMNRQVKDAIGLYDEANERYNKEIERIGKELPASVRGKWDLIARDNIARPSLISVSKHESGQRLLWTKQETEQAMNSYITTALNNYADQDQANASMEGIARGIRAMNPGADEDYIAENIRQAQISLFEGRISTALQRDDLAGARSLFETNKKFLGDKAPGLEARIEDKEKVYKYQGFIDDFVKQYGPAKEQAGIQWIRQNNAGDEEEKLVSMYKQRINEMNINEMKARAARGQREESLLSKLFNQYYMRGEPVPSDILREGRLSNELSIGSYMSLQRNNDFITSKAGIMNHLAMTDKDYAELPTEQQESIAIARSLGITEEDRRKAVDKIRYDINMGLIDSTAFQKSSYILTQAEKNSMTEDAQMTKQRNTHFYSSARAQFNEMLDSIVRTKEGDKMTYPKFKAKYASLKTDVAKQINAISPSDPRKEQKMRAVIEDGIARTIELYSPKNREQVGLRKKIQEYAENLDFAFPTLGYEYNWAPPESFDGGAVVDKEQQIIDAITKALGLDGEQNE